jgi:hypothetical protein
VTTRPEVVEYIRTFVRDEIEANDRLEKHLEETGWDGYFIFLNSVFIVAIDRYFGGRRDDSKIIKFVAEMRARSEVGGGEIDPIAAEQMIVTVFDPDAPLTATPEMIGLVQTHAVYKALNDKPTSDDELSALLAEAATL